MSRPTPPQGLRPAAEKLGGGYVLVDEAEAENARRRLRQVDPSDSLEAIVSLLGQHVQRKRETRPPRPPGVDDSGVTDLVEAQSALIDKLRAEAADRERILSDERSKRDSVAMKRLTPVQILGLVATSFGLISAIFAAASWFTSTQIRLAYNDEDAVKKRSEQVEAIVKNRTDHLAEGSAVLLHEQRLTVIERTMAEQTSILREISTKLDRRR